MKIKTLFFILFLACMFHPSAQADWSDWLEGANGYARAGEQAKVSGKPMLVYFYTDWCPYCRKFEKHTLANPDVKKALSGFIKVRINPEKGDRENKLSNEYRIDGFPSIFFENPSSGQATQEMTRALKSAEDFMNAANEFSKVSKKNAAKVVKAEPVVPAVKPAAATFAPVVSEQILYLTNGRSVEGKIVKEDAKGVTLATSEMGEIYFSHSEIKKIEKVS